MTVPLIYPLVRLSLSVGSDNGSKTDRHGTSTINPQDVGSLTWHCDGQPEI